MHFSENGRAKGVHCKKRSFQWSVYACKVIVDIVKYKAKEEIKF